MERKSHISLDPDVIKNNSDGRISLSSLYGFSVFSEAAEEHADGQKTMTKKRLEKIDREVFLVSEDRETERLEQIHRQIFQIDPEPRLTAEAGRQEEYGKTMEPLPVSGVMAVVVLLLLFPKKSREKRGGRGNGAYGHGREQESGCYRGTESEDPGRL